MFGQWHSTSTPFFYFCVPVNFSLSGFKGFGGFFCLKDSIVKSLSLSLQRKDWCFFSLISSIYLSLSDKLWASVCNIQKCFTVNFPPQLSEPENRTSVKLTHVRSVYKIMHNRGIYFLVLFWGGLGNWQIIMQIITKACFTTSFKVAPCSGQHSHFEYVLKDTICSSLEMFYLTIVVWHKHSWGLNLILCGNDD